MKLNVAANDLSSALVKVRTVVPNRTTLPILETILFDATGDKLTVTASSIDMEATATVPCEIVEPGKAAISANIVGIVKALGKKDLSIDASGSGRAVVNGSRQKYEFGTLDPEQFPIMARVASDKAAAMFELPAADLKAALDATRNTSSTLETQFFLNGVCMCLDGRDLAFVSTDKHRFSRFLMPAPSGADRVRSHIIPSPAVAAFVGMLDRVQGSARVTVSDVAISVEADGAFAASKLVAGEFLNYRAQVAALPNDKGLRVTASELSEAVSRIISLRAETKAPVVTLTPNGSSIELASDKRGRNEGREVVDAEVVAETPEFSVSTTYLAGLLATWPESASLDIAAPLSGGPITITSPSVPGLFQLVMPMTP